MSAQLTETRISAAVREAAATGQRLNLRDPSMRGLRLRITPRDVRTWSWVGLDVAGRVRRFTLGRHPHVGVAEARRLALAMAYEVRLRGADPVAAARTEAARQRAPQDTLATLLGLYGRQRGHLTRSWETQLLPSIQRVFASLLPLPLAELTVDVLQRAADDYPGKPSSGAFGVRNLLTVLRWASKAGRHYVAPELLGLETSVAKPQRDRVLSRRELAALLPLLVTADTGYVAAHHLLLLTATRRGELAGARWRDVDLEQAVWHLPQTKSGQPHTVPLSRQAVALLRRLPGGSDPNGYVVEVDGRPLKDWDKATATLQAASGTAGWHRHDLRRTAATLMAECGVIPDIIEASLNHVIHSQLAATYNRHRYGAAVADALQRLADLLDGIAAGTNQVVPIRTSAA